MLRLIIYVAGFSAVIPLGTWGLRALVDAWLAWSATYPAVMSALGLAILSLAFGIYAGVTVWGAYPAKPTKENREDV